MVSMYILVRSRLDRLAKVKVVELLSILIASGNPRGVMLAQLAQSWTNVGRMFVW